jgi:hypothetical protein
MYTKKSKLKVIILTFGIISLLTINSYGVNAKTQTIKNNTNSNITTKASYDINVSIKYKIFLGEKVKKVDTNIIKAARQGLFYNDCSNARFSHYNGYSVSYDVLIFDIKEVGKNAWTVYFKEKQHGQKDYIGYTNGAYSVVNVEKDKSGAYRGYIINPGGPMLRGGETY